MGNETRLTVYFEDPFWVGVYERIEEGQMEVARIVFGPEPRDYEVCDFLHRNWAHLRFSPPVQTSQGMLKKPNPKRMQRQINQQMQKTGVGTRAQQALKLQQEAGRAEGRKVSKQLRQQEEEQKYLLKQQKKKEKHRGR